MLEDPLLQRRIGERLARLRRWPAGPGGGELRPSARRRSTALTSSGWRRCGGRYRGGWCRAGQPRDAGLLDLIASGATHGFLPLCRRRRRCTPRLRWGGTPRPSAPGGFAGCGCFPGVERCWQVRAALHLSRAHGLAGPSPATPLWCAPRPSLLRGGRLRPGPRGLQQVWVRWATPRTRSTATSTATRGGTCRCRRWHRWWGRGVRAARPG
jgi:hypothetical protein